MASQSPVTVTCDSLPTIDELTTKNAYLAGGPLVKINFPGDRVRRL